MTDPDKPTLEQVIADWTKPRQAVEILKVAYGDTDRFAAKRVLHGRLRGGQLTAIAIDATIGLVLPFLET
jgi:hypothetical protein